MSLLLTRRSLQIEKKCLPSFHELSRRLILKELGIDAAHLRLRAVDVESLDRLTVVEPHLVGQIKIELHRPDCSSEP